MKFSIPFILFFICTSLASGQVLSRVTNPGDHYLQSLIQDLNGGFIGLTTKDTIGTKNIMLVRLDDSLKITWTRVFIDSENRDPVFLRRVTNGNLLFGAHSPNSSLLLETDSSGNILHQWDIRDSLKIIDAIRTLNNYTYLLFEKDFYVNPFGNLHSMGIGYIDTSGSLQSLYWSPSPHYDSDPINFAESNSNDPFFIIHQEDLNYWDCWLGKTNSNGALTNNQRFEVLYDIQLHRRHDLNYFITGATLVTSSGPSTNFFLKLNSSGNYISINDIQFLNAANYYEGLSGIKCVESTDGGFFCAGRLDNKIFFFKRNPNDSIDWAYSFQPTTNNAYVNAVLNCTDHGFLMEVSNFNRGELIKCDSNGITSCVQTPAIYTHNNIYNLNNAIGNAQQQLLPFTSDTINFVSSSGNYGLQDQCLTTNLDEYVLSQNNLLVKYNQGNLFIEWEGNSKFNTIQINLYDLSGKLLLNSYIEKQQEGIYYRSISFENFPNGIYFIKILSDETPITSKFIKIQ